MNKKQLFWWYLGSGLIGIGCVICFISTPYGHVNLFWSAVGVASVIAGGATMTLALRLDGKKRGNR